ncbi:MULTISPECIES: hypothetical protein [unclassified Vibrio]|uniref:hypothetical protein n=1 Tax=unclassified Vibrio TaxID=2614977 RepID=UPI001360F86B|nr:MULTISPECIES: hypothetical protein [unclassified Vibrio]NAW56478.1 hypothetical protein [Vibrio sp. V36_P2S2PM302]NAX22846.1 hypothetical protein [Vibrio sp. V39_P1S14PM300]NAX27365.1 hypothetical protein [Vibrio sp. V38_P2S17PM301]NAX29159.1 hypothetical protein [Vibrio sp. V37_P2S8PM304]
MDKPIVYLTALILAVLILIVVLSLDDQHPTQVSARILETSQTQSLDGIRKYLTVQMDNRSPIVLIIPPSSNCESASRAKLDKLTDLSGTNTTYRFISCH